MSKYSKINFIYFLQKWMDSVPGQTFLNYAYSWGAAVVILGTLFKLTHLPGANFMLFLGMGTEVIVFFISAFDRPFDKTTIDMELDNHMADNVIDDAAINPLGAPATQTVAPSASGNPAIQTHPYSQPQSRPQATPAASPVVSPVNAGSNTAPVVSGGVVNGGNVGGGIGGGTIVIGGGSNAGSSAPVSGTVQAAASNIPSSGTIIIGGGSNAGGNGSNGYTGGNTPGNNGSTTNNSSATNNGSSSSTTEERKAPVISGFTDDSQHEENEQKQATPQVITPAPAVSQETAAEMEIVTKAYIERLAELNEMLEKVGQLTSRLSTDSEEMENLNRTLTGIARVYEMQLKSASQQITTQDSINEQTRIMAQKIQELNNIYTRMIEAMTVNMPGGMQNNA